MKIKQAKQAAAVIRKHFGPLYAIDDSQRAKARKRLARLTDAEVTEVVDAARILATAIDSTTLPNIPTPEESAARRALEASLMNAVQLMYTGSLVATEIFLEQAKDFGTIEELLASLEIRGGANDKAQDKRDPKRPAAGESASG